MTNNEALKLFEGSKVRMVWDDKEEKCNFSIVDVVSVLTQQYVKRMKNRDEELKVNWGTICILVPLVSEDSKRHKEMTATARRHFPHNSIHILSQSRTIQTKGGI